MADKDNREDEITKAFADLRSLEDRLAIIRGMTICSCTQVPEMGPCEHNDPQSGSAQQ
jgi:hypothetical protein